MPDPRVVCSVACAGVILLIGMAMQSTLRSTQDTEWSKHVLHDVAIRNGSGILLQDIEGDGRGRARLLSGIFKAGLTPYEKVKNRILLWLMDLQKDYLVDERATRGVVLLDALEATPWHEYARHIHRHKLSNCTEWQGTSSSAFLPVTAYTCNDVDVNTRPGATSTKLLELFTSDEAIIDTLERVYDVNAADCEHVRDGILISIQQAGMTPDTFHPDLCTGDQVPTSHKGLTVISYPHDSWDISWRGHFELQGPSDEPVVAVAPLPNRSIIMDGCIRHRATNAVPNARPVVEPAEAGESLGAFDRGRHLNSSDLMDGWRQWRFALVMQIACPFLDS